MPKIRIFITVLLASWLTSCVNNNDYLLQKAEELLTRQPDSCRLYLAHILPEELSERQQLDYWVMDLYVNHLYRLPQQKGIEELMQRLETAYAPGHPLRHRAQELALQYRFSTHNPYLCDRLLDRLQTEWSRNTLRQADWLYNKVMVKSLLGQTDSVTTYTERLLRTGRLRQELYAWQGQQALNRGDTADAIRLLQKVLQHSTQPEMHRQYTRLVLRLLEEQGQYEEALRQLQAYRA